MSGALLDMVGVAYTQIDVANIRMCHTNEKVIIGDQTLMAVTRKQLHEVQR